MIKLISGNQRKAHSFSIPITLICPNNSETYFKGPFPGKNTLGLAAVLHVRSHDSFVSNRNEPYIGGNIINTILCCKMTDRKPVPLHDGQAHHYSHSTPLFGIPTDPYRIMRMSFIVVSLGC